ncbi:MAG TPA: ArsB/NhaD family transporter [Clostridiales bacterium]|nr:ArsB/NhaD family transporter [Clostridiales bacterium]
METNQLFAIAVFVLVMAVIVSEKIHRAAVALAGGIILILSGIISFDEGIEAIDFGTLGVLLGMMLFVAVVKESGLFEYMAIKAAKIAKGDPWRIMIAFMVVTAVLSAFLDNVTTVLLVGPMTITICQMLKVNPVPFLITEILASNIGGTATLIGDPPNIMIGSAAHLSFLDFLSMDAPVVVVIMIVTIFCFRFIYGKKLTVSPEAKAEILTLDEKKAIKDEKLFKKSLVMIFFVVLGFMLHGVIGIESSVIALAAGILMVIIGGTSVEEAIHHVEWPTLLFFIGLFVVVGALEATGVITLLANMLIGATAGKLILTMLMILWISALLSAILDNIPFVATMIPLVLTMEASGIDVTPLWWAISLGACLGGNGTLIGASANVVLSGISNRQGYPITFLAFLKIGMPMMLLSIVISSVYLLLRFAI